MRNTTVALKTCTEYESQIIFNVLKEGFDLLGGLSAVIKPHHKVLIKPDLYQLTEPNIAKTTNPNVVSALAELISKIGAKCIIADSAKGRFTQSSIDNAYIKTKMLQASNEGNSTLGINDKISVISNPNGEYCRDIHVIDAINDVDVIINVGKLRCDKHLGLIGCSQNLFGLVPGRFKDLIKSRCYTLNSYYNYLIDLYEALENKIVLNILDAVVGNESNSDPRILNTIIIGENPYAVDATALKLINQSPSTSLLLNEAVRRKKFEFGNTILGDKVESLICNDFKYVQPGKNINKKSQFYFKTNYNLYQKRPTIPNKSCKGCSICAHNCPMKAISLKSSQLGEYAVIDYSKCISCFKCVDNCPYKIIKTKTPLKYKTIDKMLKKRLDNKNK